MIKFLTNVNIVIGIDGEQWIYTNRQKTDSRSNIPLLPMAEEIITKYKDVTVAEMDETGGKVRFVLKKEEKKKKKSLKPIEVTVLTYKKCRSFSCERHFHLLMFDYYLTSFSTMVSVSVTIFNRYIPPGNLSRSCKVNQLKPLFPFTVF